jgi:hypothetical protein
MVARRVPAAGFQAIWTALALGTAAAVQGARRDDNMSSSWPIVLGIFAVIVAAFWYDATIASANSPSSVPAQAVRVR